MDGDEIFDPAGLAIVRHRIMQGEFDSVYSLGGNYFNCAEVCWETQTASGYMDARGSVKMGNLSLVQGWENENRERLHGHPIFTTAKQTDHIYLGALKWEDAIIRCLHLCFMQRSSGIKRYPFSFVGWKRRRKERIKPNPSGNPHNARHGPGNTVEYKMKHYAIGEIVQRKIAAFVNSYQPSVIDK